jgi:bifunctional DNA-binding transcriptional regulator/antitoxin component of YhaV-PrlF toxin-antitoxin module
MTKCTPSPPLRASAILAAMPKQADTIRFEAKLLRPATPKAATWTFLVLPAGASAKLPTRAMVSVEGTFGGQAFEATLEPDGNGSHWVKVPKKLREAAGVEAGDTVAITMTPSDKQLEPDVPKDLRDALEAHPGAKVTWDATTTTARRDWIAWMTSGKQAATRGKRRKAMMDMLEHGKKRVCCFDRSGMYGDNFSAPEAAAGD